VKVLHIKVDILNWQETTNQNPTVIHGEIDR